MKKRIPWYFVNPKDGTEMVLIPGGWFWMGNNKEDDPDAYNSEKPRHLHFVKPFYMSMACITVEQFGRFVKATGHDAGTDWGQDPDHPIRDVNWHDGKAYCKWSVLKLPTESEWELAARGYEALKYPWGKDWEGGKRVCWDKQKGPKGNTCPVFDHPDGVSSFGTFQQSGNLLEWCEDAWDRDVYYWYANGDFSVPEKSGSRVLRGASWRYDLPKLFRGGNRSFGDPALRRNGRGFRVSKAVTF